MKLTAESFLTVVKRSGLIEPERLKQLLDELRDEGVNTEDSQILATALVDKGLLTSWQAEKLKNGKSRGFFLGKYRLMSLLGKGGMSSVYLAEHVLMRRRCAIKVLPQKRVNDSSYLGRFHREAQAVASLDHANIVRAYDVDVDRTIEKGHEIHFLVMEYVEGRSLQEVCAEDGVMDFVTAADYIRQAADGLAHAHAAGMVHRDIKPGNLLVDNNGTVKILDLGLARFFADGDEESLTVAHDEKVLGTADYLAPEQALDSHKVDARADIYSLGCTLYFLLTGHPPFTEGTLAQRLMAHQSKEPPPIEDKRADLPPDLSALIQKMMAKKLEERFQTATEVSEALAGWLTQHAPDQWKSKHPLLSGSGSTPGPESGGRQDKGNGAAETQTTAAAETGTDDDNLNAFLTNLGTETDESSVKSPSDSQKSGKKKRGKSSVVKQNDEASAEPSSPEIPAPPVATPVAQPVEKVPVAKPVSGGAPPVPVAVPVKTSSEAKAEPPPTKASPKKPGGGFSWNNKTVLIGAIAAGVLVLVAGIFGIVALVGDGESSDDGNGGTNNSQTNGNGGNGGQRAPEIKVGPDGQVATISDAIKQATKRYDAGDRAEMTVVIRVQGGRTYDDRILLDNTLSAIDALRLRFVCEDAKPAILKPTGSEPVIQLIKAKHITVSGFQIESSGDVAISLEGGCYGTTLSSLTVSGARHAGIQATNLKGFLAHGDDVNIKNVTFQKLQPGAVGIRFTGESSRVHVSGCRFLGPMAGGIVYEGDSVVDSSVKQCVFHQSGDGLRFSRGLRLANYLVQNNTFHSMNNGVVFQTMPSADSNDVAISQNLFAQLKQADVTVRKKMNPNAFRKILQSGGLKGNMSDRNSNVAGNVPNLFSQGRTGVALSFVSTKPSDPQFLMPKSGAAHSKAGANTQR